MTHINTRYRFFLLLASTATGYAIGTSPGRDHLMLLAPLCLALASLAALTVPQARPLIPPLSALLGCSLGLYVATLTIPAALPAWLAADRPELTNLAFKAVWIMVVLLAGLIGGWRWSDLGIRWGRIPTTLWVTGATLVAVFLLFYRYLYRPPGPFVTNLPSYLPAAVGICAVFGLTNSLTEEYLFRRLLQTQLVRAAGPLSGVLMQAITYGLLHLGPSSRPSGPAGALMMGLVGLVLGLGTHRTRGLAFAVLVHAFMDAVVFWWG